MPLVSLAPSRKAPVVFLAIAIVVVVGLIGAAVINSCPEGLVRECVHAVLGYISDFACDCVLPEAGL